MTAISLPPFVGVVTHNPMANLRFELLEQTARSIELAFPTSALFLVDNGSTDGSWAAVEELLGNRGIVCQECTRVHASMHDVYPPWEKRPASWGEPPVVHERGRWHAIRGGGAPRGNFTPGAGRFRLSSLMRGHAEDRAQPVFCVWSDDDMLWKAGAEAKLRHFYHAKPHDIDVVAGLLEPVWHWNTPRETVEAGGVRVLVRDSAPGAAWSFPSWLCLPIGLTGGVPDLMRFGYDYECCKRLREKGRRVAQIDLADHIGWGYSTHGNDANEHVDARPLDREKWGV